ncbi:hypothetical protein [Roseomonas elaeocarpi]|uniref:EF-hand domain-containing protein n=1 Tax=Roseomonas elaeocarpi TaxID=907779 RepID=A0ABV6JW26_9PROT
MTRPFPPAVLRAPLPSLRPSLAAALVVLLLAAAPGGAQVPAAGAQPAPAPAPAAQPLRPIPEALRGAWFSGSCAAPDAMLALTARSAAEVTARGTSRLDRFLRTREAGGWLLGVSGGAEAPRLMIRARPAGESATAPGGAPGSTPGSIPAGAGATLETARPDSKALDEQLPGATPVTAWTRCDPLPLSWALRHGEGIAVLGALEGMEAACGPTAAPQNCAEAVVAGGDISGDRLLSTAEVARLARGIGWVLAVADGSAGDVGPLAVSGAALSSLGTAQLLVSSLDFDGDGRLSARELLQDRAAVVARGNAGGRPLRLDGLTDGLDVLRSLVDGLLGGH